MFSVKDLESFISKASTSLEMKFGKAHKHPLHACMLRLAPPSKLNNHISVAVRSEADIFDDSLAFAPVFTHQVFGENEAIFGYKDLKVKLYHTPDTLSTYIGLKYTSQSDSPKPDNVVKILSEYIPEGE